jgi:hypothetical protein
MLTLMNPQINLPQPDVSLFKKHEADIVSLAASLSQLLPSREHERTVPPKSRNFFDQEWEESLPWIEKAQISSPEPVFSQPLDPGESFVPVRGSALSAPAFRVRDASQAPSPSTKSSKPIPPSQHGRSEYSYGLPPVQMRIFAGRNSHHINYPVIPRWQDRARLRRIQVESPELLPNDLPPWSVREQVPTVPQPDWSENGRFLKYDGFSTKLFVIYEKALGDKRVPIIAIPYSDCEMKRVLVEKGVLSEVEADIMMENGRESWRGPMEGRENEKYNREMRLIEEGGKKRS